MLFKIRKFVPIHVLRLLYFSFVHHLQYCVISWGTANNPICSSTVSIAKQHIADNDF